jgi:hypothetical protein
MRSVLPSIDSGVEARTAVSTANVSRNARITSGATAAALPPIFEAVRQYEFTGSAFDAEL